MPKRIIPLSDVKVRNAKPQDKDYKLADGGGLFLLVTTTGGKLWRFKYHFGGMEKLLTLGKYPIVSISDARQKRDNAKQLLDKGIDPSINRKAEKAARDETAANSFEKIAREWHGHKRNEWSPDHATTILTRLEKDIFPWIGNTSFDRSYGQRHQGCSGSREITWHHRSGKAFTYNYRTGIHLCNFHGSSQFQYRSRTSGVFAAFQQNQKAYASGNRSQKTCAVAVRH